MAKTIVQKLVFKNTTPKALYDLYMDAKMHALICGADCEISAKEGTKFSVYGGYATGKILQLIKDKLIVQSWRASDWDESEMDSTFIINLETKGKDVVLHAVHANLPDAEADSISQGWRDFYWNPWTQHLTGETVSRPEM